jgi:general secretion pathway protein N
VTRRIALLMCAAGIAVAIAAGGAPAAVNSDPDRPPAEADPAQSGNPLWTVPLEVLHGTRERPIFAASRRPPKPSVAVAVVAAPPPPRLSPPRPERPALVLLGTVSGETLRFGIFNDSATTKTVRLAVGESFEGWILRTVSNTDARFEYEGQTATLELRPGARLATKGEQPADAVGPASPRRRRER